MEKMKISWKPVVISLCLMAVAAGLIYAWYVNRPLKVDRGHSEMYSDEDIDRAVEAVKADFASLGGGKLLSLTYAGDERCKSELAYCNELRKTGEPYTECIVLDSEFLPPARGVVWEDGLYRWNWILARSGDGPWIVVTKGYG